MDPSSSFGAVVRHLTLRARQTGRSLQDSWFGNWKPRNTYEASKIEWLRHLLLGDPDLASRALAAASRYNGYEGPLPQLSGYTEAARDVYWQARVMFLIAGYPLSSADVRDLGADRALRAAELCLNGASYTDAVVNSARAA